MNITKSEVEDLKQTLLPVRNRFDQAIEIQRGACNIRAIARVLVEAADACATSEPFVQPSEDPAVRLIVHQLAFLTNVNEIEDDWEVYPKLVDACKSQANLDHRRGRQFHRTGSPASQASASPQPGLDV